ncbi:Uncharacterized protein PECH_000893 [Penicillium ucsense]|uniref:N-acetyltransferase domain-containing protein n=1 Tax=Penicillium ucsense TaxID=2839758 RepID=A0A8J8W075_9EURO|nr:Uncharacterized protein PECM_000638 [Penicillium ucsense]KAF7733283.1 Uncharacterized protein PECH_000893 [Penicillium ucsense]
MNPVQQDNMHLSHGMGIEWELAYQRVLAEHPEPWKIHTPVHRPAWERAYRQAEAVSMYQAQSSSTHPGHLHNQTQATHSTQIMRQTHADGHIRVTGQYPMMWYPQQATYPSNPEEAGGSFQPTSAPFCTPSPERIYVRSAKLGDFKDVLRIINWYSTRYALDWTSDFLTIADYFQFLQVCLVQNLPFLVLVKVDASPKSSAITTPMPGNETICGLAYVDIFEGDSLLGDLRVYVCPKMNGRGYGNRLVDCILSIMDWNHQPQFLTECQLADLMEKPLPRLKRLTCAISYPAQREEEHAYIWYWLMRRFAFKYEGESKQDRPKHGHA